MLAGTWRRVVADDPSASPGRIRIYLASPDEVRTIAAEVDGRAVQLGSDLVSISVASDRLVTQPNRWRGRGSRAAAPANA